MPYLAYGNPSEVITLQSLALGHDWFLLKDIIR